MSTLNDISQKLQSGYSTSQLIKEGYAKSSVNHVARKLKRTQPAVPPTSSVSDELQELRHRREIIKIQKEIAELETTKMKLPDRMAALKKTVVELQHQTIDAVDTVLFISLKEAGWSNEKALRVLTGWEKRLLRSGNNVHL